MSSAEFQERLNRISGNSAPQQPEVQPVRKHRQAKRRKFSLGLVGVGGGAIGLGQYALRYASENYAALKAADAAGTIAGFALVGVVLLLIGVAVLIRAAYQMRADPSDGGDAPRRVVSTRAQTNATLIGFFLGGIACFILYLGVSAHHVGTQAAISFATWSLLASCLIAALSLLTGLAGIFLHGYALWCVPVHFCFGGLVSLLVIRMTRINLHNWPDFAAMFQ